MIAAERHRTADLVESLTPEQLATPSLCREWTVQQVAGHLLAAVAASRRLFLGLLVRDRLNIHRANARLARRLADRPSAELAAELRRHAENPIRPPVVGYPGQLTDLQVHGQDMRRPLGLPHALRPEPLRVSLDFLTSGRTPGFAPRSRTAGLRFEAVDLDWAAGAGPVVRGPAEPLLLALAGRPVTLAELDGDGVPELRRRLRA